MDDHWDDFDDDGAVLTDTSARYKDLPEDFEDQCVNVLAEVVRRANGKHRPGQEQLLRAWARTVRNSTMDEPAGLAGDAPTGTGKSFVAVIVAAMAATLGTGEGDRRTTVIATATKLLQDQYVEDLLLVQRIMRDMGHHFTFTVLKGTANYVCNAALHDLKDGKHQEKLSDNERPNDRQMEIVNRWLVDTPTGDINEIPVLLTPPTRNAITCGDGECPGKMCPSFQGCYAYEAKRRAKECDIVVVNTTILCMDGSFGGTMLPRHACIVADEAHKVEDIAAQTFGTEFRPNVLLNVARRFKHFLVDDKVDHHGRLEDLAKRFDAALADRVRRAKREKSAILLPGGVGDATDLEPLRAEALELLNSAKATLEKLEMHEGARGRRNRLLKLIEAARVKVYSVKTNLPDESVMWVVKDGRHHVIRKAPLEVADRLAKSCWSTVIVRKGDDVDDENADRRVQHMAVLAMSATLPAGTKNRLGMPDAAEVAVPSPFDYRTHSLMYVPNLPEPIWEKRALWRPAACAEAAFMVQQVGGRSLLLFSSFDEMRACAEIIGPELDDADIPWRLEDDGTKKQLIDWMRNEPGGVIFASQGWFEGVNLTGDICRLVALFTLPITPPGEPLNDGRREAAARRYMEAGKDPKTADWLASLDTTYLKTASAMRQATGRLIRSENDYGVVLVLDPRIVTKKYGPKILKAMPPFPRTQDRFEAEMFVATMPPPNDTAAPAPLLDDDEPAPTLEVVTDDDGYLVVLDTETGEKTEPRRYENWKEIPAGHYAIQPYGKTIFVRVTVSGRGFRQADQQQGSDYKPLSNPQQMSMLNAIIRTGVLEASMAYGRELGHCGVCTRELTNEESRERGIGPVCFTRIALGEAA